MHITIRQNHEINEWPQKNEKKQVQAQISFMNGQILLSTNKKKNEQNQTSLVNKNIWFVFKLTPPRPRGQPYWKLLPYFSYIWPNDNILPYVIAIYQIATEEGWHAEIYLANKTHIDFYFNL